MAGGRAGLVLVLCLGLGAAAVPAMPVPSHAPSAAVVMPASGGSDATDAGLIIGITLSTMVGLCLVNDNSEGNDVYGYIALVPIALILAANGGGQLLIDVLIHIPWPL
jgi:hypothetical protein